MPSSAGRRRIGSAIFVAIAAIVLGTAFEASAQPDRQLIVTVVDQTGGALPHATVTVKNPAGTVPLLPSEGLGTYTTEGLDIGRYTLVVEAEGFAPATRVVEIRSNRPTEVKMVLTVRTSERVEVLGLKIGTPNSITALTLSGDDLALLPNNEIELLYRLRELSGSRGRPGDFAIYVDGFREYRRLPPKRAIDVIQINAEPYSAQFPEPGTRRIEIITKPGADGTFGEVKTDITDAKFNAREPLAATKPKLQRRSGSAYFSAPIVRQKWGFYLYAGRWDQDEHAVVNATTLDENLAPTRFERTLLAPQRLNNVTGNTGLALGQRTRLKFEYSRDWINATNQGLMGGFDLPERAISVDNVINAGRLGFLSVLGPSTVFETRVQVKSERGQLRGAGSGTAIMVLSAFNAGANQSSLYRDTAKDTILFDSKLTKVLGSHNLKLGTQIDRINFSQVEFDNFGGTFTFGAGVERDPNGVPILNDNGATVPISPLETYRRTLLGLPGYKPTLFTLTQGDPSSGVKQWEGAVYVQDDWIPSTRFTLSSGLRYEAQTNLDDLLGIAPRIGMAWVLGERVGTVRAGAGAFYRRFDPMLTLGAIQYDGIRQRRYVVGDPTFSPPPVLDDRADRTVVVTKPDDLRAGRLLVSNVGYERPLGKMFFASATYTWEQGHHLTRSNDINVPLTSGGVRPDATRGQVLEYQSAGRSRRHELQTALRVSFNTGSSIFTNYTYATAEANTDDAGTMPADARDLENEWGPSATDERHRVYVNGTLMLPHYFMIIPSFTAATPRPYNITTGFDNNLDGHVTDRPSLVAPDDPSAILTPFGALNPFPRPGETLIGRNAGRGARMIKFDLSLAKVFVLGDPTAGKRVFSVHLDAHNVFNATLPRDYNGVLLSPTFGRAYTAELSRRITLGLGFNF